MSVQIALAHHRTESVLEDEKNADDRNAREPEHQIISMPRCQILRHPRIQAWAFCRFTQYRYEFVGRAPISVVDVLADVLYTSVMKFSIRRLALCLLLLVATPFQGYAGLAMIACDSSRVASSAEHDNHARMHTTTHPLDSVHHSKSLVQVGLSQFANVTHDTTHASAFQDTADTPHTQPDDSIGESATQHSCCSACVLGALDSLMVLRQPIGNSTQFNYSSATHVPPTLAGLERPPRRHLG